MSVVLELLGAALVLTVLQDVFTTVLFPASGRGIIRKPLARATWALFRAAGRLVHGRRRRSLLAYGGPTQIVLTLTAWFVLLLVGWAMVYEPALGSSIVASSGPTDTSWTTALYYSGFSATTLGTGDVVAATGGYRVLTIAEAGIGFLTFTMVISYFLSVYSALPGRNALAQRLHQRTHGTGDAAVLLAAMGDDQELPATDFFGSTAARLREIYQTHRSYPVLRYFHYRDLEYGLPRMLLVVLDLATLVRTVLDADRYAHLVRSPQLAELIGAADSLLDELAPGRDRVDPRADQDWRRRIARVTGRLRAAGLRVRNEADAAGDYAAARATWEPRLRTLAAAMLYRWDEVYPVDRC